MEVHEVFLDDALQVKEKGKMSHIFFRKRTRKSERADADEETGLGDVVFPCIMINILNPMAFFEK